MLGYLSLDIICSEKGTVFRERSSRKTVSLEASFYATGAVLKIGGYLTIIPRARMGSESMAHEAEEPMRARGIIVLVKFN